jgi:hypothetical protein
MLGLRATEVVALMVVYVGLSRARETKYEGVDELKFDVFVDETEVLKAVTEWLVTDELESDS